MMEQLQQLGPVGIGIAIVVVLVVLMVIRKLMTMIFLVVALGFGGWALANENGWDVPFLRPGEVTDADRSVMQTAAAVARSVRGAAAGLVQTESLDASRSAAAAAPAAVAPSPAAQAAAEDVRSAEIRYNAPTAMQLNMPTDIRLVVDASGGANPESELEGLQGDVRGDQVDLTEQVTASLTGAGFEIRPLTPLRRVLSDDRATIFQWEVTPRREGSQTLTLEVFAHPGGSDAADEVATYSDRIEVDVTFWSQALDFVQTAHPVVGFAAGGVSLLLAGMSFVRRRRK